MGARCTKCTRRHKGCGTTCLSCLESYCWSCWDVEVDGRAVTCEECRTEARNRTVKGREIWGKRAGPQYDRLSGTIA